MAVADFLSDIGRGAEKAAKAVGSAALPIAERAAQVVSGEAPKIDEEERKQQYALEDEQLNAKAAILENQLAIGQKYGTLTPEQQQQYIDQITGLYSHPRHAGTLMEKLRKAIHPQGTVYGGNLPVATPPGGTAAADAKAAEQTEGRKLADALTLADRRAEDYAKNHKPTGKSPPLPGNQLPPDAVGVDGQTIPPEARSAEHSFVEYQGAWWPVAKPKPVFKTVKGHSVLVDPQSGNIVRDLGPTGTAKVTTRQTLQPGDDGQMHMVTLTSVTTPEGAQIDVQPSEESPAAQPSTAQQTTAAPKSRGVGSVLPKAPSTGAKTVSPDKVGGTSGKVVPGLSSLANRKLQTTQDRQVLESSKQIISSVDDLLPLLEKRKSEGGLYDAAKQRAAFAAYKAGIPVDPELTKIFENSALLDVVGASIWSRIGRSRYTFEIIQQHLPKPTDTPQLMYDKVKWLKEHVVPAAQEAIKNPQPDTGEPSTSSSGPKVLKFNPQTGRLE